MYVCFGWFLHFRCRKITGDYPPETTALRPVPRFASYFDTA